MLQENIMEIIHIHIDEVIRIIKLCKNIIELMEVDINFRELLSPQNYVTCSMWLIPTANNQTEISHDNYVNYYTHLSILISVVHCHGHRA